jgi:acyl-CoA synthetase (AMP-forming)/AMP-acid ligase II
MTRHRWGALLRRRAEEDGSTVAYRVVSKGKETEAITHTQLLERSTSLAAHLADRVAVGERVALVYEAGIDFLVSLLACLQAGLVAVPCPPIDALRRKRTLPRLLGILEDATPKALLTHSALAGDARAAVVESGASVDVEWISTDQLDIAGISLFAFESRRRAPDSGSDVAVLQYTSGSTSDPKGVVLSHENIFSNLSYFEDGWQYGHSSCQVTWLPNYHDLGLVNGLLTPLYSGVPAIIMSPVDVILNPRQWLEAMSRYEATHTAGPDFAYELCVLRVRDPEGLDLRPWRVALNAAEPVRASTIDRFSEHFVSVGFQRRAFCAGYGMSEATCKSRPLPRSWSPRISR